MRKAKARSRARSRLPARREQALPAGISFSGPTRLIPDNQWLNGTDANDPNQTEIKQPYAQHAWVYAAVRAIATNISQVPLVVHGGPLKNPKVFNPLDSSDTLAGTELARLLDQPHPHLSGAQLIEVTALHLNLSGDCAWVLDRETATDVPDMITPISGHELIAIFGEPENESEEHDLASLLIGWVHMAPTGKMIALRKEQVLFFRFVSPYNSVYGLAPLTAASFGVKLDYLASIYSAGFFANSADPSGVIQAPKRLNSKQMEEVRAFWEARHKGPGNAKRVGVLYGGMEFKPITVSQKDMEFIEQRRMTRDQILAVFKVPKSEVSLYEDINMATAVSQDRSFWNKTLIPIARIIEATVRVGLVPGVRPKIDPQLRIFFDLKTVPALQDALTEKILNAEKLTRMGYPINIVNEKLELGLPALEWGNTWYVNKAILPIEKVLEEGTTDGAKPPGRSVDAPDGQPEDDPEAPEEDDRDEEDADDEGDAAEEEAYFSIATRASLRLKEQLHGFFRRLRRRQLADLSRDKSLFNFDWALGKLRERVDGVVNMAVAEIQERLGRPVGAEVAGPSYPEQFIAYLRTELSRVLDKADVSEAMQEARGIFNRVATDRALLVVAKLEVARRTRRLQ